MKTPTVGELLLRSALVLLTTTLGTVALAADAPSTVPSNGGMAAKLQPFIDNQDIAGAVVLVADKDKVLDLEAVGYANLPAKKPMLTTDLFYAELTHEQEHDLFAAYHKQVTARYGKTIQPDTLSK